MTAEKRLHHRDFAQRVVAAFPRLPERRRLHRRRAVRSGVGHRQQHLDERDAVGVAVVDAHDHRAAPRRSCRRVVLPHRPRRVERRGREAAHERLQLLPSRPAGQARPARRDRRCRNRRTSSQYATPITCTGRWWKRVNRSQRSRMTACRRRKSTRSRNSITPQIIIRLPGRSIRSHAVSTAEIFSRLALGMRGDGVRETASVAARGIRRRRGAQIARLFSFALK